MIHTHSCMHARMHMRAHKHTLALCSRVLQKRNYKYCLAFKKPKKMNILNVIIVAVYQPQL